MDIKLVSADIVILATAHNPSVLSPEWLKEKKLISKNLNNFIYTPDLSVCESNDFSLVVDRQRLNIASKMVSADSLNIIKNIAMSYIKLLPNIPYTALGMNFAWMVKANASEITPDISIKIDQLDNFSKIFPDHELSYGCIIKAKKPPYLLKLIIEPKDDKSLVLNFNYHHEIRKIEEDKLVGYIGNFIDLLDYSRDTVKKMMINGE